MNDNDMPMLIITTKGQLKEVMSDIMKDYIASSPSLDIGHEKLTRKQVCELAGITLPTLARRVKDGSFIEHGSGRKRFYLKSQIIEALKK